MELWAALKAALRPQPTGPALLDTCGAACTGPELLHLAGAAAALLRRQAASPAAPSPGPRVCALYLSNSAAYVVAALAALRLGLALMPLDPAWPLRRLQELCDEAQPAVVVWAAAGSPGSGGHGAPPVTGWPLAQLPELSALAAQAEGKPLAAPAAAAGATAAETAAAAAPSGGDACCCYVLYTSGSTGRPLGVCGTQRGVLNRCRWLQAAHPFQAGDRVAFKTAPAFVDSIWELLGPLLAGVPLVAVPQAAARDPAQLLRTLAEQRITHLAAVPTLWRALAATLRQQGGGPAPPPPLCLRLAVSSGEALAPELLSELQQLLPAGCRILNLYGSTEVAADCTAFDCTTWRPPLIDGGQQPPGAARVPVGQPIGGTLVAVLAAPAADEADSSPSSGNSAAGEQRAVLPVGSVGEVALAGAGLAAGYLGAHPAAAAAQQQRFVELPTTQLQAALQAGGSVVAAADLPGDFWQQGSARCFLTGDLGWLDASGCLHLAGRRDHQVKISGVRIDLAEVEAALAQHPAVAAAAAKLWQLAAGPVLAGYVQLAAGLGQAAPSTADLRAWCEQRLPAAAVPRHLLTLPLLPRSPAGKVLCSQLPHPLNAAAAAADADQQQPSKRPRAGSLAAAAATAAPHAQQPGGVSELAVSRAFARALGHSDFEATSNLFAVGGNSLHAAQIAGEVAGGDVAAVIAHPTVRSLAAFLSARAAAVAAGGQPPGGQQQQEQQPAAVEARQLLAGGSSGSGGAADGPLQLAWRARMLQCVDAAPLLEPETAAAPAEQEQRAFACSHGGDICCYDARSGRQLWQAQMLGCTDAGLALCAGQQQQQLVAVGTNSGTLCFLDASSGSEVGSLDCGGGIRAPPAVDPWRGLVWQPTHGRQLLVAAAPGREVARLPLPAAASAAVVFAAEQRLAFVCCLDGSVLAIATPDAGSSSSSGGGTGLQLQVAWQRQHGAPLFAPAVPLPRPAVAVASVDGSVSALGADDGTQLWRASVGSAVFAPLLALALEPAAAQQQQRRRHVLLAGTQAGRVAALDAATGERLAAVELGAKVTGLAVAAAAAGEDAAGPRQQQLLVVTLAPGIMVLLDAARLLEGGGRAAVLDAVRLPGDTFAPPAAASSGAGGVRVAVGCRDDHLYCLELPGPL